MSAVSRLAPCLIKKADWDMNGLILRIKANLPSFSPFLSLIHLSIIIRMEKDTRVVIVEVELFLPKLQASTSMMDPILKAIVVKERN